MLERISKRVAAMPLATMLVAVACAEVANTIGPEGMVPEPETPFRSEPLPPVGFADAFGIWSPSGTDTCSTEIHDRYQTVGQDGLVYPTWHPPVDPVTGCWFGHEHGDDPRTSDIYDQVGDIPFGYANQYLVESGFPAHRHEDHVGHKVSVVNDLTIDVEGRTVVCDVLMKLHQGTHSPDAFTNNLHELAYHIRCSEGTGMSVTVLVPLGTPGGFEACEEDRRIEVGAAVPPQSPAGDGARRLPTAECLLPFLEEGELDELVLEESWEADIEIFSDEEDEVLAVIGPYFQVFDPSRYFDPAMPNNLARPGDLCLDPRFDLEEFCSEFGTPGAVWDSPDAVFKGVVRAVDVNANVINNEGGPNVWYTDPIGRRASKTPFPGALRQWFTSIDNQDREIDFGGVVEATFRDYDAPGVRAPN